MFDNLRRSSLIKLKEFILPAFGIITKSFKKENIDSNNLKIEDDLGLWYYVGFIFGDIPCHIYRNILNGNKRSVTLYDFDFYRRATIIRSVAPCEMEYNEIREEYLAMLKSMDRKTAIDFLKNKYRTEQEKTR